jgi:aspartate carbamoyltransferase catalytic subunit
MEAVFSLGDEYLPMVRTPGEKDPVLNGRCIANIFFEDSTRTRNSFTRAGQLLSADFLQVSGEGSSTSKGETEIDTAKTIEAMGVDTIVVRHASAGVPRYIADNVQCCVINAGDGRHEHPTQGPLDIFTLRREFGADLSGMRIAIVGDIVNSRVVRSNIFGLRTLGVKVIVVGPPMLAPDSFGALGVEVAHDLDAVLPEVDVVMMLRVQFERFEGQAMSSVHEYREGYGLTAHRCALMPKRAVVMHPGPMNRGLEIDSDIADGPRSIIFRQVTHGVAIRMAVLRLTIEARDRLRV